MRQVRRGIVLVAALVLGAQARASETLGVLAVAPPPGPGPALVELTVQLRDRVAEYHPGVLSGPQLRERMLGLGGAAPAELDRAYEGARAAYVAGDHEESVRTLRAIVEELEKLPDGDETFSRWTRAMLRLARSEQALGRDEAARACVERLVRAAPDLAVDRAQNPARVVDEVERARAALAAAPPGTLAIGSSVPGARVFLDGREVGAAPLSLAVAPGRHRVSGAHGALRAASTLIEVEGGGREEVFLDFTVAEALRPHAGPGVSAPDRERAARVVAAGAHLRLDSVLAVGATEEAGITHLVGSLFDVRRGVLAREGRVRLVDGSVPLGGSGALAEFLVTGQASSALVEVPGAAPRGAAPELRTRPPEPPAATGPSPSAPTARARRSRAIGWVSLGVGMAAIGLTVLGVAEVRDAEYRYELADGWSHARNTAEISIYNGYVAEGDASRRRATTAFVGAGVAAVSAGVLGWIQYRRTGEFGPFRF